MFGRFLGFLSRRRRRAALAERLLISVEQLGSIPFDREAAARLGLRFRPVLKIACCLALQEKLHIEAGEDGKMVLLSNREFLRLTESRADAGGGPAASARHPAPVPETGGAGAAKPAAGPAVKSAPERQSLPERRRKPWRPSRTRGREKK